MQETADIDADLDVDAIAAAVCSCPGVSALSTVPPPATDAPEPSRPDRTRPDGADAGQGPSMIAYDAERIDVAVVAFYGLRLAEVADQVEQALRPLIGARHLIVTVEDLDTRSPPPNRPASD